MEILPAKATFARVQYATFTAAATPGRRANLIGTLLHEQAFVAADQVHRAKLTLKILCQLFGIQAQTQITV